VSSIASEQSTEGLLKQAVQNDPNSIGFISNYQVELGGVNSVAFNGVACNKANAASGQYAGVARFYEVTKGRPAGAAGKFISWIKSNSAASRIISTQWIPTH
jgi:ABC-type phosphate transport system substrate-binding protein